MKKEDEPQHPFVLHMMHIRRCFLAHDEAIHALLTPMAAFINPATARYGDHQVDTAANDSVCMRCV